MDRKTLNKPPLRDVQIARAPPCAVPDARSVLPWYPFDSPKILSNGPPTSPCFLSQSPDVWPLESAVAASSGTSNYHWSDSLGDHFLNPGPFPFQTYHPLNPPISLPALPCAEDTECSYQGSRRVLLETNGEPAPNPSDNNSGPLISPGKDGLPEDMRDILRQLDDLASWVKAASSPTDHISNTSPVVHTTSLFGHPGTDADRDSGFRPTDGLLPTKGKTRLLSASPAIHPDLVECSRSTLPGRSTKTVPSNNAQSATFIYVPDCDTPEFLVGSSSSPIAYPVYGYSSHPPRHSPRPPDQTYDRRRFLDLKSAPCPSSTSPLLSPPFGKTSFKSLFQRSRCNTASASRPSISLGHVPAESTLRQGKKIRLPWLRI